MKAELDFAGQKELGGLSYKYIPFTPREIEQHLAMYMIQGLNPAPQLKMKSKSQSSESMQGNDLVFRCIALEKTLRKDTDNLKDISRFSTLTFPYLTLTFIPTGSWILS